MNAKVNYKQTKNLLQLLQIFLWGWLYGAVGKSAVCDYNIPQRHLLETQPLHFPSSALLMYPGRQQKMAQVKRPL